MSQGLLNDVLFKIVFGVQNSEPVLMALLNALLGYTGNQKIVSLTIVNPTLDKEYLQDKGAVLSDVLELHYIELRKFSESKPHALRTPFEKWLYILKFSELDTQPEVTPLAENLLQEEGIQMAIESLQKAYARDEVRELIRAREKARRDYLSGMKEAEKQGLAKGLEKGLAEGLEKGLEKGRTEGLSEGLVKGRTEVARQMLARGLDLDLIQEVTGLSRDQLSALEPAPPE